MTDYSVNYEDERFKQVEDEKNEAITSVTDDYNQMINQTDDAYNDLISASKDYAEEQKRLQQEQSDQTIKEIEQNKEKAKRDYTKESMASYADYQKEKFNNEVSMYNMGLSDSGYSESSLVSMYNTYQNRVASAKQSYTDAVTNYDNQITNARLANSSALAEIAYNALQQQLQYSLEAFQYKNTLTLDLIDKKLALDSEYYNRRQDVVSQINTENALAEEVRQYNEKMAEEQRQYNESMAYQKERDRIADEQWQKEYNLSVQSLNKSSSGSGSSGTQLTNGSTNYSTSLKEKAYGNSSGTRNAKDYFFKSSDGNNYQPRYIYNQKIQKTGQTGASIGLDSTLNNKNIWSGIDANGNQAFYVWVSKDVGYIDVTKEFTQNNNSDDFETLKR